MKQDDIKGGVGSSFDDFLIEEGMYAEVTQSSIKALLANQISVYMAAENLTKTAMARRMKTSRAALDRLLDPENTAVTLDTLTRAATAVGRQIRLEIV